MMQLSIFLTKKAFNVLFGTFMVMIVLFHSFAFLSQVEHLSQNNFYSTAFALGAFPLLLSFLGRYYRTYVVYSAKQLAVEVESNPGLVSATIQSYISESVKILKLIPIYFQIVSGIVAVTVVPSVLGKAAISSNDFKVDLVSTAIIIFSLYYFLKVFSEISKR